MKNQNGTKNTVTLSTLLSIGTILISLGINFLQSGQYVEGIVCVIVGFGIICIGVYLFRKGVIEEIKKQSAEARKLERRKHPFPIDIIKEMGKRGRPRKE